jgi:hypothetical protein
MKPVVADLVGSRRHRLHTLAISGANQARNVSRAHPPARLVPQRRAKRRKPAIEFAPPVRFHHQPPQKLALYESVIPSLGNPKNQISAKVMLGIQLIPLIVEFIFSALVSLI